MSKQTTGFNKTKRLLNSEQYRKVMRKGLKTTNSLFLLVFFPNDVLTPRLGITVSKKVSKHAVERNRIKRQGREFFRYHQHSWPNYDFVLIANPAAAKADNTTIVEALENIWAKAGRKIAKQSCS